MCYVGVEVVVLQRLNYKLNEIMSKQIGVACDHAGFEMKEFLVGYLISRGYEVSDFGAHSEERVDFPDFAHALADSIQKGEVESGLALCGSGEGMVMTLNRHKGIRAGLCWNEEVSRLIRQHNDANVIVLPARFITNDEALSFVDAYLAAEFEGERHENRVRKIEIGC